MENISLNKSNNTYSKSTTKKTHRMIVELINYHKTKGLNTYNFRFISSICSKNQLSYKQKDYLSKLHKRYI